MAMATVDERTVQVERVARETKHPVRVTALAYLSGALANERYEECISLLSIAQEFGATEAEIHEAFLGASAQ